MTQETIIIGTIRLLGALPVLRWPLAGALLAILVDFSDLFLMNWLDLGGLGDYQRFDKIADLAYMLTFAIVATHWQGLERRIALALLAFRLIGVATFELTGVRSTLLLFPNVFEFWFIFVAARHHRANPRPLSSRRAAAWLVALISLKLAQEFILHQARWLDAYVATEVAADLWQWIIEQFGIRLP